jgi:tetratricopeptide (TPR) repeat protein
MTKRALEKIYVILSNQDKEQLERLCDSLSALFSYVNFTSNLYLVSGDLSESMLKVERIHKDVGEFLRKNLFARLYVHFVHRVPLATMAEVDFYCQYYYQPWKRMSRAFDREGYMHQEVPRLMLLPVIVLDNKVEPSSLAGLLHALKRDFLLPSVYLDEDTFFLARNEDLVAKTEKVYYGRGNSGGLAEIVCNLCHQDILEDSTAKLESGTAFMTDPCPAVLIITAQDGMVYGCLDAFLQEDSLANIYTEPDVDSLMSRYYEHNSSKRHCLVCRDRAAKSFSDLPLPKGRAHEIGALLYRFGTLHQEAENHVRAVENYEKSLELSPAEEAGSIHFRIGLCHTKAGSYDQALESFKRAEPTCHDHYFFHFYTGCCHFEQANYAKALEKFSKAIRLRPQQEDLVRILIYMGTCYNHLGKYEEALIELEKAKEAAGNVKEICSALGFSYFQLKDYDRAIENLSRAVELDPDSAIDYASLGANYREKGDIKMAIAVYEKALKLDPSLAAARQNLERLRNRL